MEAGISYLKRCFGLDRCNWSGRERFHAYVHSAVFAHNLMRLARLTADLTIARRFCFQLIYIGERSAGMGGAFIADQSVMLSVI